MTWFKKAASATVAMVVIFSMTACVNQATISALVTTLGNAAASVATIEGNPALGQKLQADVAIVAQQVLAWKSGSNAQLAIEAIAVVEDDLALFPQVGPYLPLIELSLVTLQSILTILEANSPPASIPPSLMTRTVNVPYKAPKDAAHFKAQWNGIVAANGLSPDVLLK